MSTYKKNIVYIKNRDVGISILHFDGLNIYIRGVPGEYNVDKRKSWIKKQLCSYPEKIFLKILPKIIQNSYHWYNYITYGCKYKEATENVYDEWDNDKIYLHNDE